jgi:hypothetical protein
MSIVITLAPFLVLWNSKICLAIPLSCFCNWIRLIEDVNNFGGSLPDFPGLKEVMYHGDIYTHMLYSNTGVAK